jgi:hypothetical protein
LEIWTFQKGATRQMLTLPYFQFGSRQANLPTFAKFIAKFRIKNTQDDRIFAVLQDKIVGF